MAGSPVKWWGGKSQLAHRIVALLPPHRIYVEVFAGSAAVLLTKTPSSVEVLNDADGDVVHFLRVLREQPEELERRLALTPYSRAEWGAATEAADDPIERARRWFIRNRQSHNAERRSGWGYSVSESDRGMAANVSRWWSAVGRLGPTAARLARVQIECDDWRTILTRYDTPETCYYLDPPYHPSVRKRGGYAHEMTARDHEELVQHLLAIQGTALISGYACHAYEPLERAGWSRVDWPVTASGIRRHGRAERVESLWVHPRAQARDPALRLPLEEMM